MTCDPRILSVVALLVAGCGVVDPFHTTFADDEPAERYEARRVQEVGPPPADAIEVATWNIKFAGGRIEFFWECPGDRVNMTEREVRTHLERIGEAVRAVDADLLILQEVDVDAKRSAYVDQVQWLLDHTDYNYGVYASQWKSDYVPSDGIGRMDSGNAILSRWPIRDARRIALPLIKSQGGLTRYFWLRRNILDARIAIPERRDVRVLGTHTAAFAEDDTTRKQIARLADRMASHDGDGELVVAGGDLNTIPPGSTKEKDFEPEPPEKCDLDGSDYSGHDGWTDPLYDQFEPAVSLEAFGDDNGPHFTFSSDGEVFWNRKLDYLFTNGAFVDRSATTYQSEERGGIRTLPLSDHAPVSVGLHLEEEQ